MSEAEPKDRAATRAQSKKNLRLTPPPRVSEIRTAGQTERARPAGSARRRYLHSATLAASLLLAVAAVVVFGFLPRWVEERRGAPSGSPPAVGLGTETPAATPVEPSSTPSPEPLVEPPSAPETVSSAPESRPTEREAIAAPKAQFEPGPSPPVTAEPQMDSSSPGSAPGTAAFREAMSTGLAAMNRQDYSTARDHFRRAVELAPDSPEAAEALVAAEEGLRLQAIAEHRQKAFELEAAERWRDAVGQYEAVLALDPTIKFAREGLVRSRARAELAARLDFHLRNPERLSSERVLRDAEDLLEEASQVQPAGLRLKEQVEELGRLVVLASTPVRVTLLSDNLTEVTVYKVGKPGTFERLILELRPGTYTVVGRRSGYRDVRRELRVTPGQEPEPLTVRCEEKI